MLIEVKAKTKRVEESGKVHRATETYLTDRELFAEAEAAVTEQLGEEQASHLLEEFEIQSLRISSIREICDQYRGEQSFVATLKDIFVDDNGVEKPTRYKVLLWADDLTQCNQRVQEIVRQGYSMKIESILEKDFIYLDAREAAQTVQNSALA